MLGCGIRLLSNYWIMVSLTTPPAFWCQGPCYLILYMVILDVIDAEEAFVDRTKHGLASDGMRNCMHAVTAVDMLVPRKSL